MVFYRGQVFRVDAELIGLKKRAGRRGSADAYRRPALVDDAAESQITSSSLQLMQHPPTGHE